MKKIIKMFAIAFLATSVSTLLYAQQKTAQNQSYHLAVKQSEIKWKGPKSAGNKHYGTIHFNAGTLNESVQGKFTTADFSIDMKSINTMDYKDPKKNEEVNQVLSGPNFFGVKEYPTGRMTVQKIVATAVPHRYQVSGNLVLRGISKPITFIATLKKLNNQVNASANFTIDRHQWGIDSKKANDMFASIKDQLIADEIPIVLQLVFNKI